MTGKKKALSLLTVVVLLLNFLPPALQKAEAAALVDLNDSSVFLKQKADDTCTPASALMMFRRGALINENTKWSSFTESAYKGKWWSGGLINTLKGEGMTAVRKETPYANSSQGQKDILATSSLYKEQKELFIRLLSKHPEGIVVWLSWRSTHRHAVLLTDYKTSPETFYCADPAGSTKRIKLSASTLAGITYAGSYTQKTSNTQEDILAHIWAYWVITSGIEYCKHMTADGSPDDQMVKKKDGSYVAVCRDCGEEFAAAAKQRSGDISRRHRE